MNHLSPLLNHLKKNVSRDRTRFDDDRFDLDLTYITDNIIAMAFPASGIEAVWRNHIDDVAEMLKTYHDGHYKIWNLSERTYDYSKFDNQTVDFGFPDHHSPPLKMLFEIVWSMYEWLRSDKHHVAAVHCMGGKGRTGTVICAYLIFVNRFQTPDESFAYFATKRSAIEKGVTQPSQKRYVRYFSQIIQNQIFPKPKVLTINKIMLVSVPGLCKGKSGCNPVCRVYSQTFLPKVQLFSSSPKGQPAKFVSRADGAIVWKVDVMVAGDILIKGKHAGKHRSRRLFRFAFHTAFINDTYVELKPEDLDDWRALKDTDKEHAKEKAQSKGEALSSPRADEEADRDFSLILYFNEPKAEDAEVHIAANKQEQALGAHYEGVLTSMFAAKKTMRPYEPEKVEFTQNPIHREDQAAFAASRLYQEPTARLSGEASEGAEEAKSMLREYYERQLPQAQGQGMSARERLASLRQKRQEIKDSNGMLRDPGVPPGAHLRTTSQRDLTSSGDASASSPLASSSGDQPASPRVASSPRPLPQGSATPPVPPLPLVGSPRSPRSDGGVGGESSASPTVSPRKATEPVPVTPWVHTSARLREELNNRPTLHRSPSDMSGLRSAAAEARRRAETHTQAPVGRDLNPLVGTITLESGEEAEISIDCILGPRSTVRAQALAQFEKERQGSPAGPVTRTGATSPHPAQVSATAAAATSSPTPMRKATVGSQRSAYASPPAAAAAAAATPPPVVHSPVPVPVRPSPAFASPTPPLNIGASGTGAANTLPPSIASPTRAPLSRAYSAASVTHAHSPPPASPSPSVGLPPPTNFMPPPSLPPPPPPPPTEANPPPAPLTSPTAAAGAGAGGAAIGTGAGGAARATTGRPSMRASRRPMLYEASEVQTLSTAPKQPPGV